MCSKQNRRFKSKLLQYNYRNKWLENILIIYHDGMGANAIQIKVGITVNPDVSVKTSYIWKRLYLESCYMLLQKCKIFSKHYEWFSKYVWWNYRGSQMTRKQKHFQEIFNRKKTTCKTQMFYI